MKTVHFIVHLISILMFCVLFYLFYLFKPNSTDFFFFLQLFGIKLILLIIGFILV